MYLERNFRAVPAGWRLADWDADVAYVSSRTRCCRAERARVCHMHRSMDLGVDCCKQVDAFGSALVTHTRCLTMLDVMCTCIAVVAACLARSDVF